MKVVINGAGIAGPSLAYWLLRGGHEVVLVEKAEEIRSGGYIIDFWGIGYDIAEKMGSLPRIKELGYQVNEVRLVDSNGEKEGGFIVDVFHRMTHDRFTSVRRSDISTTVYNSIKNDIETILGDSIAAVEDHGDKATVRFDHAAARDFDLVIGADGLHSKVREIVFGPESKFEKQIGYHVAAFEADGYKHRDELVYMSHCIPGRQISRFSMRDDKTLFLFIFEDKYLIGSEPDDLRGRKAAVKDVFGEVGWETPEILDAMELTEDIYFDRVSQIRMDKWSNGRTALIGDAAACVSLLAGEGTGLAIAEAYVLAGELNKCGGDHAAAFARYESRLMSFLEKKQDSAAKFATSFAPSTAIGITFRNLVTKVMGIRFIADYFFGRAIRDEIVLPEYDM